MITMYGEPSNAYCQKVTMVLDAMALPYVVRTPAHDRDDDISEELARISPNRKVPAIIDTDTGVSLFESAAILLYLADKTGMLLPANVPDRAEVYKWLIFDAATLSAVAGELFHYVCVAPEELPYAQGRYRDGYLRCASILEAQLGGRDFLCDELSIADCACAPWIGLLEDFTGKSLSEFPNLSGWLPRVRDHASARRQERQEMGIS